MVEITDVVIKSVVKRPGREGVDVWAEVQVRSTGDRIYSYHLRGKSLLCIELTPHYPPVAALGGVFVTKYMMNQGQPDNYCSVWVWKTTTEHEDTLDSVWLNVHALLV